MNDPITENVEKPAPKWRPISSRERRVLGVLVEKAKTTPDVYPMSINALVTGSNQKNNRYPLMELDEDDVEQQLDKLRAIGAVIEVQGSSRVRRFKHSLYEWLGVDKTEIAIMAELLLRGAQTEGELRGRAARMEPITDVATLRPLLDSLKAKKLIISLTPEGRGHVLTHGLYEERELDKLRAEVAGMQTSSSAEEPAVVARGNGTNPGLPKAEAKHDPNLANEVRQLAADVRDLHEELNKLREEFDSLAASLR